MAKNDTSGAPLQVGLISLGCAKNLVDAEIMLGALLGDGMQITNDPQAADVVIVNTCSFIDAAQEESVDAILESDQVRAAHRRGQGLVVSGCLPQRFRAELPTLLPEVDAFMGIDQVAEAPQIVRRALARRRERLEGAVGAKPEAGRRRKEVLRGVDAAEAERPRGAVEGEASLRGTPAFGRTRTVVGAPGGRVQVPDPWVEVEARPRYIPDYATPRFRLTPRHFAYLKIAEGCNHPCSFCIIPRMRGAHRSRGVEDVVTEARGLLADGVRELNLISQDSTYYGLDLRPVRAGSIAAPDKFAAAARALPGGVPTLSLLLRELDALPGDFWIRLLYTHPAHWTDELIETIAASRKVARYVDMPLQHIHDVMLERMRRETTQQYIVDLIRRLRAGIPGIALRTTFIVGFPGETEARFERLLEFMEEVRFERLGVFLYSQEAGTRAASMAGQVAPAVKEARRERAMAVQRRISRELAAAQVGRTLRVLTESVAGRAEPVAGAATSWEHGLIRAGGVERGPLRVRHTVARGEADAPDIDGRVFVRGAMPVGEFVNVRVTGHTDYDLLAEA